MNDTTLTFLQSHLNRYQIKERLGTGGMARVYRAHDTNLERQVAIKVLHEHLGDDPTFTERFQREARLVASFNHPNIIQVYDFDTIKRADMELAYMVMSYIPGDNLQQVLDDLTLGEEKLDEKRVLNIMRDICSALDFAHMKGMVHRDVKPANILFDQQGRAILTDFGIARPATGSNLTQEGTAVGTPAYMSPEQAMGQPVDARSDIYALGIILYELIAGQPPFGSEGDISILMKHVNEPPPSLSEHGEVDDPFLDAVIFRALAKDPADRYQSAKEFIEDVERAFKKQQPQAIANFANEATAVLDKVEQPAGVPAPIPAATGSLVQQLKQSPLTLVAVGMTLVALVLFIGLFIRQDDTTSDQDTVSESSVESMTGDFPEFFTNNFDADDSLAEYWPTGSGGSGITRTLDTEAGVYRIENQTPGRAIATLYDLDKFYTDVVMSMTARLDPESGSASGYGIIFRYVDANNYNVFAVDGLGRYSVWLLDNGSWRELRGAEDNWTEDDSVMPIGHDNALRVEIKDSTVTGYVNDHKVTEIEDDSIESGRFGVYLASPAAGSAFVIIDSYQVMEPAEYVDSMTGDEDFTDSMTGPEKETTPEATAESS